MKKLIVIVTMAAVLFSQGCCSIFTSGPQTISVNSKPEGAKVKVGPHSGVTPYKVTLPRGKDYIIEAAYQGKTQTVSLTKSIEPIYWINILFWPGLIVDIVTGDMFKYEPTEYRFDFTQ